MSEPMTHDEALASIWGFGGSGNDAWYLAPLPVIDGHPSHLRPCGNIGGVTHLHRPPYVVASPQWASPKGWGESVAYSGAIEVMLCEGDGWRANIYGDGGKAQNAEHYEGASNVWMYADSENVPPEWRDAILAALGEIRRHWPDKPIVFRPEPEQSLEVAA